MQNAISKWFSDKIRLGKNHFDETTKKSTQNEFSSNDLNTLQMSALPLSLIAFLYLLFYLFIFCFFVVLYFRVFDKLENANKLKKWLAFRFGWSQFCQVFGVRLSAKQLNYLLFFVCVFRNQCSALSIGSIWFSSKSLFFCFFIFFIFKKIKLKQIKRTTGIYFRKSLDLLFDANVSIDFFVNVFFSSLFLASIFFNLWIFASPFCYNWILETKTYNWISVFQA